MKVLPAKALLVVAIMKERKQDGVVFDPWGRPFKSFAGAISTIVAAIVNESFASVVLPCSFIGRGENKRRRRSIRQQLAFDFRAWSS